MLRSVMLAATTRQTLRQISTSGTCLAGGKWRESQGLSRSGNEYGPLTDLPDWSYADGRPAPPGANQLRRKEEQKELAERIDMLSKEMLQAKETNKARLEAAQTAEENKRQRRLKPKGSQWKREGYVDNRRPASDKK